MDSVLKISSYFVLLIISSILGFLGKAPEMGLAIASGAIGLAFSNIDKIARFKGAGFEAEMREQLEAIIEKETEIEVEEKEDAVTAVFESLNETQKNVVLALTNPSYTWRSSGGICEETSLSRASVARVLKDLSERELIASSGSARSAKWALTTKGRKLASDIVRSKKQA